MQGDHDKCLAAGMNDYLAKPIQPKTLGHRLAHWLAAGKAVPSTGPVTLEAPPPPQAPLPVFDGAGFLERLMGDEALARLVIAGFLEDIPRQMALLQASLENRDLIQAGRQAHVIKGAAANVGAAALAAAAARIEITAEAGRLETTSPLFPPTEKAFADLKKALSSSPLGFLMDKKEPCDENTDRRG